MIATVTDAPASAHDPHATRLADLIRNKQVLVLCGAGGVGKTTSSAALALQATALGRRVLVLTIDPARRLAQALGIPPHSSAPTPVPEDRLRAAGVGPGGALDAWMIDPRVVFEQIVRRLAPEQSVPLILNSRLYAHMGELVAGMQEYTAGEAMFHLASSGKYDLVVLDTPPSRNALDFLDAPGRLTRFLDENVVQVFLPRDGGLVRRAGRLVGGVFSRVFGEDFVRDLQEFMGAFSGMFAGMRREADGLAKLLESDAAAFVLVTSPEEEALREALFFKDEVARRKLPFAGFVLNRSHARLDTLDHPAPATSDGMLAAALEKLRTLGDREKSRATNDSALLARLRDLAGPGRFAVAAPHLGESVEDLPGLAQLARGMMPGVDH